jgi:hypothetical protein
MKKTRTKISLLAPIIGFVSAVALAAAFHYRILPFLKADTVVSGGHLVPSQEFADSSARLFLCFAPVCLILGLTKFYLGRKRIIAKNEK